MLTAGELRTRIAIASETRTDDGVGGFTTQWLTLCSAWARKRVLGGGDATELNQTVSRRRVEYTVRRRADVTIAATMRVVDHGSTYEIKAVEADDRDLSAQTLICEEAVPDVLAAVDHIVVTP